LKVVKQDGLALMYASKELKNNKEMVMAAFSQNANTLYFGSEQLQNDKELLLLLENCSNVSDFRKGWYEERMEVLAKYREKEALDSLVTKKYNSIKPVHKF
jgi:hypothetical protein